MWNSIAKINIRNFDNVFVEYNSSPNVNDQADISWWIYHPFINQNCVLIVESEHGILDITSTYTRVNELVTNTHDANINFGTLSHL